MFKNNRHRRKAFFLTYTDSKGLYYLIKFLILFFFVFALVIILFGQKYNVEQQKIYNDLFGRWNIVLLDVKKENLNYFKQHAFIKEYSIQIIKEKYYIEDTSVVVGSSEDSFLDIANIGLIKGRMPKYEKEVAVEQSYLLLLDINNIGEKISEKSPIKHLRGYTVCGIIEDYSNKWKIINWDIDYINCFVRMNNKFNDCQVYVEMPNTFQHDIEINAINYRINTKLVRIPVEEILIYLILLISLLSFLLIVITRYRVNKKGYLLIKVPSKSKSNKKNRLQKWILLTLIIGSALLTIYILDALLLNIDDYFNKLTQDAFFINKFGNAVLYSDRYLGKVMHFIPGIYIINVFKVVNYVFWILLINILIIYFEFDQYIKASIKEKNLIFSSYYFYLDDLWFKKTIINIILIYNVLEFLIFWILFYLKNSEGLIYQRNIAFLGILLLFIIQLIRNVIFLSISIKYKRVFKKNMITKLN